jgi:hypothetical protein
MIGSLIVLLGVVAAFVVFRDVNRADPADPVQPVDFRGPAEYARSEAPFPLLAPRRLPPGWVATSVRYTAGDEPAWHLGTLTDEERYVGLEQSTAPTEDLVEEYVDPDAVRRDDVELEGRTWQAWTDAGDDLALVHETPKVTTLVVGRVPQATLGEFIATLR